MRQKGNSPATKIIYALILVIFVVALAIGAVKLMEWNQQQRKIKDLERQKEELTQESEP